MTNSFDQSDLRTPRWKSDSSTTWRLVTLLEKFPGELAQIYVSVGEELAVQGDREALQIAAVGSFQMRPWTQLDRGDKQIETTIGGGASTALSLGGGRP
ncbi:hypothetical protein AVEN_4506-1 [Araneus ventricosus]|uniref:Uncharacterized protein n=1 Tax=Araneus ventricosus TaxID=182803 RepID=A0A4Y2BMZ9_ARAVE|nr:hypothetical protein AVEN_4506-1 [Araneus ventricosus]